MTKIKEKQFRKNKSNKTFIICGHCNKNVYLATDCYVRCGTKNIRKDTGETRTRCRQIFHLNCYNYVLLYMIKNHPGHDFLCDKCNKFKYFNASTSIKKDAIPTSIYSPSDISTEPIIDSNELFTLEKDSLLDDLLC